MTGGGQPGDPVAIALDMCLNKLATRAHSRAELAAALSRRGVDADTTQVVLARLSELGFVDDQSFAAAVVASGRGRRSLGRHALAADLRRRGVDTETSAEALATVTSEDELASARALVARRARAMQGLDAHVRARRLAGMLARKGYPAGLAAVVVAEAEGTEHDVADDSSDYDDGA